ncbi:MAG: MerR family transcriptional regulator [Solirubrobacterales bacterium]
MDIKYYQIEEVAKLTGLTKRTIRYYEDMELLKPERTNASYRQYTDEDINLIKEIKNLRSKLGMNLAEVQHFIGLKKSINEILLGDITDKDQIEEIEKKLLELQCLIEEREAVLRKIKHNSTNYLIEIKKVKSYLEGHNNER